MANAKWKAPQKQMKLCELSYESYLKAYNISHVDVIVHIYIYLTLKQVKII